MANSFTDVSALIQFIPDYVRERAQHNDRLATCNSSLTSIPAARRIPRDDRFRNAHVGHATPQRDVNPLCP
uniref:Uncharacterized protein n=1 Tax=Vespula pensylvanica TaxID=30213 RepID=A0A834P5A8_VESPE|nr:hypothetical protein H0235_005662 [Vespula pensylvanica]